MLKAVAHNICTGIQQSKHQLPKRHNIVFVRVGGKCQVELKALTGLLVSAHDWQLKADIGKQLKVLEHTVRSTLRPDLVLTSDGSKYVVMMKLNVPLGRTYRGGP